MEPFIRNDHYNFIKMQAKILVNGHSSASDPGVLNALKASTQEKVLSLFESIGDEERELLASVETIKDKEEAELYLARVKKYVIPFRTVSESTIKKLFPKVKKLKQPDFEATNVHEITYLGWNDIGSERKYIIADFDGTFRGLRGSFKPNHKKGICSLCNTHSEIGLFFAETKASKDGNYTSRGNYICQDSNECNQKLTSQEKVHDFFEHLLLLK